MASAILDKPCLGDLKVKLRPYQDEAIESIRAAYQRGNKSTLLVLPTGCGKTITFGMIARLCIEKGGRCLILAHRKELIEQAVQKLDLLGVQADIEMGEQSAGNLYDPDCVVATVQTLQRKRLAFWPPDYFNLIIIDEAHHATTPSYTAITKHFSRARVLGVTATAERADEDELSDVFETLAYELNLWDAMRAPDPGPYLSRLKFVQCDVDIDLRDLRPKKSDFSEGDLEDRIAPLADVLSNAIKQEIGDRKTLVFSPGVKSAQGIATAMQSIDLDADWVSGDDPERERKVADFTEGRLKILVNCALLTEGFDVPDISAIALCRPTKSRPLYCQMAGRGTRLAPGKDDCLLIDFNYLTLKHDLVRPVDMFDTPGMDAEILEIAQKEVEESEGATDLLAAVEQAREEHTRRQVLRIKAREREIKYQKVKYDPLDFCDTLGIAWKGPASTSAKLATDKQRDYLTKIGVENVHALSKAQASTLISFAARRREKGLATYKQVRLLRKLGVDLEVARAMDFTAASGQIDRLLGGQQRRA